jgi:hypothetical protein
LPSAARQNLFLVKGSLLRNGEIHFNAGALVVTRLWSPCRFCIKQSRVTLGR